jgi:hypothetical protein
MKKRGLSQVIESVLLVLVTIVAVFIIAGFLMPWIREQLDKTSCVKYNDALYFDEDMGYNCRNGTNYYFSVGVKNLAEKEAEELESIVLSFEGEGKQVAVTIADGASKSDIRMLNASEQKLVMPRNPPEVYTYVYEGKENYTRASLYPKIKSGLCAKNDELLRILSCRAGTTLDVA